MLPLLLGTTAGLALGLVGGGGSILTVPLLVGVLGVAPQQATTMSLVIVGISALWASLPHARRGNVRWGRAALFGSVGLMGTAIGGQLNDALPPQVLLGGFSVLMVVAGLVMLRRAGALQGVPSMAVARSPIVYVGAGGRSSLADRIRARGPGGSCPLIDHGPFVLSAMGVGLMTGFLGSAVGSSSRSRGRSRSWCLRSPAPSRIPSSPPEVPDPMSLFPPTPGPTPEIGVDDLDALLRSVAVSVASGTSAWIGSGRTVTLGSADAA